MPWIRKGPPKVHQCQLPEPIRDSEWYCSRCGVVWKTVLTDPHTYDFIRDRPMGKFWMWRRTGSKMVER